MEISQTLYATTREEWRDWLREHYRDEAEIWLVFFRKQSGKPRIAYNDAVEEALCFGWIDSTVKTLDGESFAQEWVLELRAPLLQRDGSPLHRRRQGWQGA